jgi:hypothetical protein
MEARQRPDKKKRMGKPDKGNGGAVMRVIPARSTSDGNPSPIF